MRAMFTLISSSRLQTHKHGPRYKKFLVINKSDPPKSEKSPASMPTLASLLDCSFASTAEQLNDIRWGFLCMHSRLVPQANHSDFREKCLQGSVLTESDAEMVKGFCLASRVRVVKTIRFAFATGPARASLTSLAASPGYAVHVVHVVRHPFTVMTSQYNQGWYGGLRLRTCAAHDKSCDVSAEPLELNDKQTGAVTAHLVSVGTTVCGLLSNTTNAMRELASTLNSTTLLRYEDLAPPFTEAMFAALWAVMELGAAAPEGFDPVATARKVRVQTCCKLCVQLSFFISTTWRCDPAHELVCIANLQL